MTWFRMSCSKRFCRHKTLWHLNVEGTQKTIDFHERLHNRKASNAKRNG